MNRRWVAILGAAVMAASALATGVVAPASAAPCDPGNSPIVCENSKPGSPESEWQVSGAGDAGLQGFATQFSLTPGQTEQFKIKTTASAYTIDIYRLGWYGGNGARKWGSVTPVARNQPNCLTDPSTNMVDCGNWAVSASWTVPSDAVSGVYIAHLVNPANNDESHIPFVVRNDASHSDVIFQTSDSTWQAYNYYGGANFYSADAGLANGRALKLSYNRPFTTRGDWDGRDFLFSNEFPMLQFLERNGYDVSYMGSFDTDQRGSLLTNHKTFVSVGHDEYWSGAQRANVEAARDAGVNLAFFSGNEVYWHTRWEPSIDGANTDGRTLVCYKETWADAKIDPSPEWTGTWRDPRYAPTTAGAGLPENGLTGTLFKSNSSDLPITVSAREGKLRLWRNTTLGGMAAGQSTALAAHTVGYESDEDVDNGFRPAGLITMSTTTGPSASYLQDYGTVVAPGTTTHHLTLYRAPSGALVFGAGTVQWSWGLSANHDGAGAAADPRIQQATVNLLADMNSFPSTIMSGMVASTKTSDTVGPTVAVTAPASGSALTNGAAVTVSGTATDTGGGVVAGVEVSMDGGTTWHPATGQTSWTYSGYITGRGAGGIKVRATDDSANIGATASLPVSISCPCSLFGDQVPAVPSTTDTNAVELGVRFVPSETGYVNGIRFYKGTANTGSHTGSLWTSSGALLATGSFTGESASGWQTLTFPEAVPVDSGTTYIASYYAPNGRYAATSGYFYGQDHVAPPLRAKGTDSNESNGVYNLGAGFPTSTYGASNYWVDVLFTVDDTTPPIVTSVTPIAGSSSVAPTTKPRVTFSRAIDPATLTFSLKKADGTPVAGTVGYDAASRAATFTPSADLERGVGYSATAQASSTYGVAMASPKTWTFTTALNDPLPGSCPCSIWTDASTPAIETVASTTSVELGVKFTADVPGEIAGIKFYKGPQNLGVHTGSLWSSTGTLLASVTFAGESSSGWQTAQFSSPVAIEANTTYVVSYRAPVGGYSATVGGLASPVDNPPLHTLASGGVYTYGTGYPTSSSDANYFVDVVFLAADVAPTVASTTPGTDATSVPVSPTVSAQLVGMVQPGTPQIVLKNGAGVAVAGTTTWNATSKTIAITPSSPLPTGAVFTATVSGATALSGQQMTPYSWSFTTSGANACPCTLFESTATPANVDPGDTNAISLGVRFVPSVSGHVSGIRFYKSAANTGTHTASLWDASGNRLATATYTGETATGWQTVTFAQPVQLTAGQAYVASYFAPNGHYSATSGFFTTLWDNTVLAAAAGSNGLYGYGSDQFPTGSYNSTNYWVDPVFQSGSAPDVTAPTVASRTPVAGSTSVGTAVAPSATFSESMDSATLAMSLKDGAGATVASTVGYDAGTMTATLTPSSALARGVTYTVSLSGKDTAGNALAATTWTFTTAQPAPQPGVCPCSLWDDAATPAVITAGNERLVELGIRFSADSAGSVTGVRFYKGPQNVGTHTGSLWSTDGTRLATGTFTGESSAGWQTLQFATPVAVTPGTTYVASYLTNGFYSATSGGVSAIDAPPLHTTADPAVYQYDGGYPANPSGANYWVDPVFATATGPDVTAPTVASRTPVAGSTSVGTAVAPSATFSESMDSATLAMSLKDGAGATVASTVGYDAGTMTATLTPSSALARGVTYTVSLSGKDTAGNALAATTWTFTTAQPSPQPGVCPCSLWDDAATPAVITAGNERLVELGIRFSADSAGSVTGVRFYKGPQNVGTHTGSLWSTDGTRLATGTFTGESSAGWQTLQFATPVAVTPGTTYVASYLTNGFYSATSGGVSAIDAPPLHTTADPAVYQYDGGYPANPSGANYWVDPVFDTTVTPVADTTAPVVSSVVATPGAGGTTAVVTWTTDESATSVVQYGTTTALGSTASGPTGTSHSVTLTGLGNGTTYSYRVVSADAAGNSTTDPVATAAPRSFATPDTAPPAVSSVTASGSGTSATVTWTTNESATSTVAYGTTTALGSTASGASGTSHSVTLTGLTVNTRYYYRVTSADPAGNSTTSPASPAAPAAYVPTVSNIVQSSVADFGSGSGGYVADTAGGEVLGGLTLGTEFTATTQPSGWTSSTLVTGGTTTYSGGQATLSGSRLYTGTLSGSSSFSAVATVGTGHTLGWGSIATGSTAVTASFVGSSGGRLSARVNDARTNNRTIAIPGSWSDAPHEYRVDRSGNTAVFFVDGTQVASSAFAPTVTLRVLAIDPTTAAPTMPIDWVRVAPYATSSTFTSGVIDAGATVGWDLLTRDATAPTGTTLTIQVRSGAVATPGTSWTAWTTVSPTSNSITRSARYVQYRLQFTSSGTRFVSPTVRGVTLSYHVL